jgi:hypothetical protein
MSIEGNLESKQRRWEDTVKSVESITDGIRKLVDERIKESVVVLKVLGFGTTASCEGHLGWGHPYPWIDVASQQAEIDNQIIARFAQLKKALFVERKGGEKMLDRERAELEELAKNQALENESALMKLDELILEFNDLGKGEVELSNRHWSGARLQPAGMDDSIKDVKEFLMSLTEEKRFLFLKHNQDVMQNFTIFLKNKYFRS